MTHHNYKEYRAISDYYGNRKAKRSGIPLISYIDEGLMILTWIGATQIAKRAFCLHPLFQKNEDLAANLPRSSSLTDDLQVQVLGTVLEYRSIANAYLSTRVIQNTNEIQLGPLTDVRDMLVADKVQNNKDFLVAHSDSHPRSEELNQYFLNWLQKLNISISQFEEWSRKLRVNE